MNVYQRPLFRQAGGPVAPGMAMQEGIMAARPAMGDPMAAAQQAQNMAAQQTQGIGEQYAQQTMMNIDQAETPEQIINALRGNALPLEQRYAELAQFVGEQDAQRTPQSVLALVQPTIMMTEQGAMDSGIGELMQGLTGQIEMETAGGEPTPMGQGVGSLMMAGAAAPEMEVGQQPVANFRQGGVVQRFQTGGEASRLQQLYSEMLPVYQGILGDGTDQRRMTQAQILFDIADRAGAFAAGIDPRTGQSMAGLSPAAQLAGAVSGLGGQIGERIGSQEEQDRALRLAALQAAQGEYSAERAAARAAASAGRSRGIGEAYEAVDADGNVIATEFLSTRDDLDAFRAANPGATVRQAREPSTDFDTVTFYGPDGQPRSFLTSTAEGRAEATAALESGEFTAVARPAPGDQVVLYNPANPETSIVATAGTPEYSQAYRMGFRTAEEIEAQRKLTTREAPTGEFISILMPDGTERSVRSDSPEADRLIAEGGRRVSITAAPQSAEPDIRAVQVGTGPVQNFDVSTAGGAEAFRTASQQPGARIVTDSAARTADPLVNPDIMSAYAAGTLSPAEEAQVQALIAENTRLVFNPQTGRNERPTVTPIVSQAERARRDAGLSTVITFPEDEPTVANVEEGLTRLEEFGGEAFGTVAAATNFANRLFALVDANAPFPERQEGINLVNTLNETATLAFRDMTAGRPAQDAVNQFATLSPATATITGSPDSAASQIRALLDLWNREMAQSETALRSGILSQSDRAKVEAGIEASRGMIEAYQALLRGLERTGGGSGVDPAQFRR